MCKKRTPARVLRPLQALRFLFSGHLPPPYPSPAPPFPEEKAPYPRALYLKSAPTPYSVQKCLKVVTRGRNLQNCHLNQSDMGGTTLKACTGPFEMRAAQGCCGAAQAFKTEQKRTFYGFTDLRGRRGGRGRDSRGSQNQIIAGG